jgi:hypothetical protein
MKLYVYKTLLILLSTFAFCLVSASLLQAQCLNSEQQAKSHEASFLPCTDSKDTFDAVHPINNTVQWFAPSRLRFQGMIAQAKQLLGDVNTFNVTVSIRDMNGQLLCQQPINSSLDKSVLNLVLDSASMQCDLSQKVAKHGELLVEVCKGNSECLRPLKLGNVPYAWSANYAYWAQSAQHARHSAVSHHAHRLTANRDLLISESESQPRNLIGYFTLEDLGQGQGAIRWNPTVSSNDT